MNPSRKIGIMGAMPEEVEWVKELMTGISVETYGMREYFCGYIQDVPVVLVFSRWGKVAASATATTLIHRFGITHLVFTGVAGALYDHIKIGDVVIAKRLVQHDLDASPMIPRFEVPLLDISFIETDLISPSQIEELLYKLQETISDLPAPPFLLKENPSPTFHMGDIGTGDFFVSDLATRQSILQSLPSVLCVEMEGAAVAQVCYENIIPFWVIRVISDTADEKSPVDFPVFVKEVAGVYSKHIIHTIFKFGIVD